MSSNSEISFSVHRSNVGMGVENQTKDNFQELFNNTKNKRKNQRKEISISKEKLLDDLESMTSGENLADKYNKTNDIELEELQEQTKENYILNKFFNNHTKHQKKNLDSQIENLVIVKPPIPKPRKMKQISQSTSQATFEVTSPKIIQNLEIYDASSSSSNKTYKVETVGEVLVHEALPSKIKILKNSNENLKENDSKITYEQTFIKRSKHVSENVDVDGATKIDTDNSDTITNTVAKTKHTTISNETSNGKNIYSYKNVVEVIIHRTDHLQLDSFVIHPVVKLHVIDTTTGKYLSKSDRTRPVVFFYENEDTDWISPVMTHTFNLQEKRILYPSWEENILLNEDFEYFKQKSSDIMLFFEILDFVSATMLSRSNGKDIGKGWHNIAFAFLKLSTKNGLMNVDRKLRLQLYHTKQSKRNNDPQLYSPWIWWKNKKLKKYPSTLYVTVKSTISPAKIVETLRSKTPVQKEYSSKTKLCDDSNRDQIPQTENVVQAVNGSNSTDLKIETTWNRNPKDKCKLPNKCLTKLHTYDRGCFIMKFSYNGLHLACGVQIEQLFHIIIYAIPSFQETHKIPSHQGLIYCIKWFSDDTFLLSASADNTVSIYNLTARSIFQILPHPSHVYCCDINCENVIVTGCYDGALRIWNSVVKHDRNIEFQLFQELEGHNGYVTCVCCNKNSIIFSADSVGVINEWQKEKEDWLLGRKIIILDLKETVINQVILFPKGKRMTVHSRDSTIRIIDVKSGCVLQWLQGATNRRFQIFGCISPCGTFILSGSENGIVHIWNSKNGREVATLPPFSSYHDHLTIHCVEFHPHENMISVSHYGKSIPILLYCLGDSIEKPSVDMTMQSEELKSKGSYLHTKLDGIIKESNSIESCDKFNFKRILDKIDSVIKK